MTQSNTEHHNSMNTKPGATDEHYTPEGIQQIARDIMQVEQFDLDPANNPENTTNSLRSYTQENSGLDQSWASTSLYCNPPFSLNKAFSMKLLKELTVVEKAVWLSKCDSRPVWARILIDNCVGVVFKKGYVKFCADTNAPFGVVLYLFGNIDLEHAKVVCEATKDFTLFVK